MRSVLLSATGLPLTSTMMSPRSIPAFCAGPLGLTSPTSAPCGCFSPKDLAISGCHFLDGDA